jgi:hypothetical protein
MTYFFARPSSHFCYLVKINRVIPVLALYEIVRILAASQNPLLLDEVAGPLRQVYAKIGRQ